jgi:5'-nucleotidase
MLDLSHTRILVTNDDGINAPGLEVMEAIARSISDDVWVVAPEQEQSGAGHSLTMHTPLRIREISEKMYAVSGTPTDCVLLAIKSILAKEDKPVTLVLSGVNRGCNVADDVTYSGTIAAAMEGTLLGIPSIAMSQAFTDHQPVKWETAKQYAKALVKELSDAGWPNDVLINVNYPDIEPDNVKGIKFSQQGQREITDNFEERIDPKGRPYYWIGGPHLKSNAEPGYDLSDLDAGYITITPLSLDLTDFKVMEELRRKCSLDDAA